MKDPQFYFLVQWDGRKILQAETFELVFLDPHARITFGGLHSVSEVEIPKSTRLNVRLKGKGRELHQFDLIVEKQPLVLTPSMSKFTHEFHPTWFDKNMLGVYDILRGWCDDDPSFADWKQLPNEMHDDWVTACRCWSGVPIGRRPLPRLEVDGSSVVSKASFYCAVGEGFVGSRGYAGGNLDGFWDCITHFDVAGHDKILRFRNYSQIQQVLDKILLEESEGKSYTETFLEMLYERGFAVQIMD